MSECLICSRPVGDAAYICWPETQQLEKSLEFAASVASSLDDVIARQARGADLVGGRSAETPLPFNVAASEARWSIGNTLGTWCRLIADDRGHELPTDDIGAMAKWLADQLKWLRHQPFAEDAYDEIQYSCWLLTVTVDRRPDLVYLGTCGADIDSIPCDADLRAAKGSSWVTCPACRSRHDVADRTTWLLRIIHDRLMTATEIAVIVTAWGRPLSDSTVRSWAHRRQLWRKGEDRCGDAVYRLGDALALAEKRSARVDK